MLPESKIRVGLAYREFVILGVSLQPLQMKKELKKFYNHFRDFVAFPEKNLDHYPLMIRKLIKAQAIYYDKNRPVLTVKGRLMFESIISSMSPHFKRKWEAYEEMRS